LLVVHYTQSNNKQQYKVLTHYTSTHCTKSHFIAKADMFSKQWYKFHYWKCSSKMRTLYKRKNGIVIERNSVYLSET